MAIFIGSIPNIQNDDLTIAEEVLNKGKNISKERLVLETILGKLFDTK